MQVMKSVAEKLEVDLEDLENKEAGKKEKKTRLKPIKTEKKKERLLSVTEPLTSTAISKFVESS